MKQKEALQLVESITKILNGKKITCSSFVPPNKLETKINQIFERAYIGKYEDESLYIGIGDSTGTMTGAENFTIEPESLSIKAVTKNGYGETIVFIWKIQDDSDDIFRLMIDERKKVWHLRGK